MRNFEGVESARLGRMRPGIIEAIDEYSPRETFKTSKIDSNYGGTRIGSNIRALKDAGSGRRKITFRNRSELHHFQNT